MSIKVKIENSLWIFISSVSCKCIGKQVDKGIVLLRI